MRIQIIIFAKLAVVLGGLLFCSFSYAEQVQRPSLLFGPDDIPGLQEMSPIFEL